MAYDVVVVSGPIGAGKSTVARALARRLRQQGRVVATADFDAVVGMLGGFASLRADASEDAAATPSGWLTTARAVHARLVRAWFEQGVEVVIADGPFQDATADSVLFRELPAWVRPWRLRLLAPFDVALGRVARDDRPRNLSLDPVFLRAAHDRFDEALADSPAADWTVDTVTVGADEIAAMVAESLARGGG